MTKPKLENGFTQIANELIEAMCKADLSKTELKIMFAIIRKTYGYHKKQDKISHAQIAEITNLQKPNVTRTMKRLEQKNIITVEKLTKGQLVGLNKYYDDWYQNDTDTGIKTIPVDENDRYQIDTAPVSKRYRNRYQNDTETGITVIPTKEKKYNKEILKEKNRGLSLENGFDFFWSIYPKHVNEIATRKIWSNINPDQELTKTIIRAVERTKQLKWDHIDPRFIPNPTTWLTGHCWNDDVADERKHVAPMSDVERVLEYNRQQDERERREQEKLINSHGGLPDVKH